LAVGSEAQAATGAIAQRARENFPVLSLLVPGRLRPAFAAVYAFCRTADDLADRRDREEALALLGAWRGQLLAMSAGAPEHPVFAALEPVVRAHRLPTEPFHRLLDAFEQDQRVVRYETWDQVLAYCRGSADPVGEIILRLGGHDEADRQWEPLLAQSRLVCTGLQLANFWQDVRRDLLELDRIYLPRAETGLDAQELLTLAGSDPGGVAGGAYARILRPFVAKTHAMFDEASSLHRRISRVLAGPVWLFQSGGRAVLRRIEAEGYATLWRRPRVSRARLAGLVAWAAATRGPLRGLRADP
jgi:squalene synthase HpnC